MQNKMWRKIGLGITAQKIREDLSYEVRGICVNSFSPNEIALRCCYKLAMNLH
jgi:hypothetical protein